MPSATEQHVQRQSFGIGHVYQGRFKSFPVKDKGDYRNLSRYVHFNSSKGSKPLADSPELYPFSSYADYAVRIRREDWIDYAQHHRYWAARDRGDPMFAYRRFVKDGLHRPSDPKIDSLKDWVYGGC